MNNDNDTITVSTNYWRVPSADRSFQVWLEGAPTPEERMQVIAKTKAARKAWKPSAEAMALVEKLKNFIGYRVQIEFWDSCMWMFPEEGPYPLECDCKGVILLQDGDFLQAFIEVSDTAEQPNSDGYSPMSYLIKRGGSSFDLAPFSDLYSVTKL
jgi:hypothetical protein